MFIISVKIDIEKDAWNWWHACNKKSYGVDWKERITKSLQNKIVGKDKDTAFRFLLPYLKKEYQKLNIDRERLLTQSLFNSNLGTIFKRMKKITGKKIYRNNFTCFLTTFPRCPYNEEKGYVWLSLAFGPKTYIKNFLHELLHFQTIRYYKPNIVRRLGEKDFEHLKEALTVIINEEFKDILQAKDKGYLIHQPLRKKLLAYWKKHKNFKELIEYGVRVYKPTVVHRFGAKVNKRLPSVVRLIAKKGNTLDLGCGMGSDAVYLAQQGFKVTAVDNDKEVLDLLRQKSKGYNIKAVFCDILKWQPKQKYDLIISLNLLHFFTQQQAKKIILEIKRSANKDGVVFIQVFAKNGSLPKQIKNRHYFTLLEIKKYFEDWKVLELKSYKIQDNHPPLGKHRHSIISVVARKN